MCIWCSLLRRRHLFPHFFTNVNLCWFSRFTPMPEWHQSCSNHFNFFHLQWSFHHDKFYDKLRGSWWNKLILLEEGTHLSLRCKMYNNTSIILVRAAMHYATHCIKLHLRKENYNPKCGTFRNGHVLHRLVEIPQWYIMTCTRPPKRWLLGRAVQAKVSSKDQKIEFEKISTILLSLRTLSGSWTSTIAK